MTVGTLVVERSKGGSEGPRMWESPEEDFTSGTRDLLWEADSLPLREATWRRPPFISDVLAAYICFGVWCYEY